MTQQQARHLHGPEHRKPFLNTLSAWQGGYDTGSSHLIAFATTTDIFVILWRADANGNYLGHRILSMQDIASEPSH